MLGRLLLFFQIFFLLIYLKVLVTYFGFYKFLNTLNGNKFKYKFRFIENLDRNGKYINFCSVFIPKCNCLLKSAAYKIISSREHPNLTFSIGIKKDKKLESHAWIQDDRNVIYGKVENIEKFKTILKI